MLRRLYDWTIRIAADRRAAPALFGVSFVESSLFPVPPDVMLVPMVLANPQRAYWFAFICTVGSVLGGMLGYAIGYFLFETVGQPLILLYGHGDQFERAIAWYQRWGAWIVAAKGLTPFPYKVITITSGFAHLNLAAFTAASIVSRAPRFFVIAWLLRRYGEPVRGFIERRLYLVTTLFLIALIGGFVLVEYLL
ncbi:MAG: YqaA family protein [Alphaproteobacteria bacterium]|mgnify:CR=1 FL=1